MSTKSILSISLIAVLLMGVIYFDDSFAAKGEPNGQPFQELQTQIDDLNQRVDDAEPDPRVDSFFDVFFDVFTIDSFFDIFTELRTTDSSLQTQIDSFENQDCDDGFYVSGIDENGQIKCKPLPSGSNSPVCGNGIVESSEQCDLGVSNGATSSCSVICTIQTTDLCLGVDVDDENECTTDTCSAGVVVHTDNGFCTESVCGDGIVSGTEACDDGNFVNGDGCNDVCSIEGCNTDTNPLCSSALTIAPVSGDLGNDSRVITDNGENWY